MSRAPPPLHAHPGHHRYLYFYRPRGRSPVSSSGSLRSADRRHAHAKSRMRWILSLGLLLPALAAIIGVVAWAVSAEVVMGARKSALKSTAEPTTRLHSQGLHNHEESFTIDRVDRESFASSLNKAKSEMMKDLRKTEPHDSPVNNIVNVMNNEPLPSTTRTSTTSITTTTRRTTTSTSTSTTTTVRPSIRQNFDNAPKIPPKSEPLIKDSKRVLKSDLMEKIKKTAGSHVAEVIDKLVQQRKSLSSNGQAKVPQIVVVAPVVDPSSKKKKSTSTSTTSTSTPKPTTKTTTRKAITRTTTTKKTTTASTTTTKKPTTTTKQIRKSDALISAAKLIAKQKMSSLRNVDHELFLSDTISHPVFYHPPETATPGPQRHGDSQRQVQHSPKDHGPHSSESKTFTSSEFRPLAPPPPNPNPNPNPRSPPSQSKFILQEANFRPLPSHIPPTPRKPIAPIPPTPQGPINTLNQGPKQGVSVIPGPQQQQQSVSVINGPKPIASVMQGPKPSASVIHGPSPIARASAPQSHAVPPPHFVPPQMSHMPPNNNNHHVSRGINHAGGGGGNVPGAGMINHPHQNGNIPMGMHNSNNREMVNVNPGEGNIVPSLSQLLPNYDTLTPEQQAQLEEKYHSLTPEQQVHVAQKFQQLAQEQKFHTFPQSDQAAQLQSAQLPSNLQSASANYENYAPLPLNPHPSEQIVYQEQAASAPNYDTASNYNKGDDKGITLHFGGGPVGGGGQIVTSPIGIFKSLMLPLLPKPRVNLNGKVVFGVVLENNVGFGKKNKGIMSHLMG